MFGLDCFGGGVVFRFCALLLVFLWWFGCWLLVCEFAVCVCFVRFVVFVF